MNGMKKILLILFALQVPLIGFTQTDNQEKNANEKQKIYLDASVGASFPLGPYAKNDPDPDATGGYAVPGFFIQANADWMGKNNFGLAFQLTYQNNSLSDEAKTAYTYDTTTPLGPGNWSNIYVMAGPVFLQQFKKLALDVKLVGGFLISTSPVFKTIDPETKQYVGGTATGFALGVNIGLGYALSKNVALKLTLGYMAGFPKKESQTATVIGMDTTGHFIYSVPVDITIKKTVSTFNTGLGIIYKF
jgi:hypothetical protein